MGSSEAIRTFEEEGEEEADQSQVDAFLPKVREQRNVTLALASEDDGSATSGEGFRDRGGKSLSIDEAGGSNFALAASTFSFSFSFSFSNDATGTVSFAGARVILTALLR